MMIGSYRTKAGAERIALTWFRTRRDTGEQYAYRSVRLTRPQWLELLEKLKQNEVAWKQTR